MSEQHVSVGKWNRQFRNIPKVCFQLLKCEDLLFFCAICGGNFLTFVKIEMWIYCTYRGNYNGHFSQFYNNLQANDQLQLSIVILLCGKCNLNMMLMANVET